MTFENTKDKETVTEIGAVEMLEGEVLSTLEVKADLFMKISIYYFFQVLY